MGASLRWSCANDRYRHSFCVCAPQSLCPLTIALYRARAHAISQQLQRDGALAVREALLFESIQDGESAEEVGKYWWTPTYAGMYPTLLIFASL